MRFVENGSNDEPLAETAEDRDTTDEEVVLEEVQEEEEEVEEEEEEEEEGSELAPSAPSSVSGSGLVPGVTVSGAHPTLNFTPYTLHPAPYTPHPAPYTIPPPPSPH